MNFCEILGRVGLEAKTMSLYLESVIVPGILPDNITDIHFQSTC